MRPRHRIANIGLAANARPARGPADHLLAEIQEDVLSRHPDWRRRLHRIELEARKVGGSPGRHVNRPRRHP